MEAQIAVISAPVSVSGPTSSIVARCWIAQGLLYQLIA
jgi:hypothetical protein